MKEIVKKLYNEIEEDIYGCYVAHWVLYTTFEKAQIEKPDDKDIPDEIALHIYFAAKSKSDLDKYGQIINSKITQEIGDNSDGSNKVVVAYHDPKTFYCVIAGNVDYNSQDIIQPNFSIRNCIQNSDLYSLARKNYLHYYSNVVKELMKFGVYDNKEEFQDHYFEDMVKIYSKPDKKEASDTIDLDNYKIYVTGVLIGPRISTRFSTGYKFFSPTKEQAAKDLLNIYANVQKHNKYKKVERQCEVRRSEDEGVIYSVAAKDYKYEDQLLFNDIFDISKAAYRGDTSVEIPALDPYTPLRKYGFYKTEKEFAENFLSDLIKYEKDHPDLEECFGGCGGVTTSSFTPAVTHTVYPNPGKKKKKSKKEDSDETIADVYSYYGCVVRLSLSFPGSDTKVRKYYVVLGKDLGQIDEFNQKINQNIKQISNDSCILSTTLTSILYSTEIKDFDFEGQKILDSSLYVNDPKKFIPNEKQLDQEEVQIRDIMGRSYDNLADFTDDLFSQMTEDTDDIYWPVRNDETDAFEKRILDARQAKKDKIIARKEKVIAKRNQNVNDWLARVGDTMDLIKMSNMYEKYNKVTQKMVAELERIKKLPLSSPEFL